MRDNRRILEGAEGCVTETDIDRHQSVVSHVHLDQGSNPQPFGVQDNAATPLPGQVQSTRSCSRCYQIPPPWSSQLAEENRLPGRQASVPLPLPSEFCLPPCNLASLARPGALGNVGKEGNEGKWVSHELKSGRTSKTKTQDPMFRNY